MSSPSPNGSLNEFEVIDLSQLPSQLLSQADVPIIEQALSAQPQTRSVSAVTAVSDVIMMDAARITPGQQSQPQGGLSLEELQPAQVQDHDRQQSQLPQDDSTAGGTAGGAAAAVTTTSTAPQQGQPLPIGGRLSPIQEQGQESSAPSTVNTATDVCPLVGQDRLVAAAWNLPVQQLLRTDVTNLETVRLPEALRQ